MRRRRLGATATGRSCRRSPPRHNELAAYRASKYTGTPHEYMYTKYSSPLASRRQHELDSAENEFIESAREELLEDALATNDQEVNHVRADTHRGRR